MDDSVRTIFKALIKVPCIIMVAFLMLNVFAYAVSYFRIVSATNTIQQAVMENNFLTKDDTDTFVKYLSTMETAYLNNFEIHIDNETSSAKECIIPVTKYMTIGSSAVKDADQNSRVQYGTPVNVSVTANYKFIMPLVYGQTLKTGEVQGFSDTKLSGAADHGRTVSTDFISDAEAEYRRQHNSPLNTISVKSTVVGMQYYADIDSDKR